MDEQKTDTKLVCQLFEDSKLCVVTSVGNVGCGRTDELEGINGNQSDCRMLALEIPKPIAHTAFD